MIEMRRLINKYKNEYKDILDKKTFNMLFSEKPLSPSNITIFSKRFHDEFIKYITRIIHEHESPEYAKHIFLAYADVTFTNSNEYFEFIHTANYIYINANTYIDIGNGYKLSYIENEYHVEKDMIVISSNNVVTNFGYLKDNDIIWNNRLVIANGLYVKFPALDGNLLDKVLSTIVLSKLSNEKMKL